MFAFEDDQEDFWSEMRAQIRREVNITPINCIVHLVITIKFRILILHAPPFLAWASTIC